MSENSISPTEVRLNSSKNSLALVWENEGISYLSAATLRLNSPSAEVKGHFGQGGSVPEIKPDLTITNLEPVGAYALKITFSDGHSTGLYTWDYLKGLGK